MVAAAVINLLRRIQTMRKNINPAGFGDSAKVCTVSYTPCIQSFPSEQTCYETVTALVTFIPQVCFPYCKIKHRLMVESKWRTGEYTRPKNYDAVLVGTTAMLFPHQATEPDEQQIQQLNYDNFIKTMADMIQKYSNRRDCNERSV